MKQQNNNTIEENIAKGLVLDEKGNWVPIAEKIEKEKNFLKHLEAGEVLNDGQWMPINFLKEDNPKPSSGPLYYDGPTELEETKRLIKCKNDQNISDMIGKGQDQGVYNDYSGSSFISSPIINSGKKAKITETADSKSNGEDLSEEFEETMSFDMNTVLGAIRDKNALNKNEINSIAESWELERKKNQVLFFSITATTSLFALIAAILFVIFH